MSCIVVVALSSVGLPVALSGKVQKVCSVTSLKLKKDEIDELL